ncbi:MAG: RDD family protein [Propionibacteriaceae bacterium]|nr:RDD family protein [Propionibacteriaceae bacterium]
MSQVETQEPLPPPGWYPDPAGPDRERYWDGEGWSVQTREIPGDPELPATPRRARDDGSPTAPPAPEPVPEPAAAAAPVPAGPGPDYAHWAWRALAGSIDGLILSVVCFVPLRPFVAAHAEAARGWAGALLALPPEATALPMPWDQDGYLTSLAAVLGISCGIAAAYHTLFLALFGASPGKFAAGLRVTPHDQLGAARLGPLRALVRSVAGAAVSCVPILGILNLLAPLWRPKRRAFHDSWAKTVVLRRQVKERHHGVE